MIRFEETFINEKKFEANQLPISNFSLHQQKFDLFLVKKFWSGLSLKEKESCFAIKTPKIIEIFMQIIKIITQMTVKNLEFFIFYSYSLGFQVDSQSQDK